MSNNRRSVRAAGPGDVPVPVPESKVLGEACPGGVLAASRPSRRCPAANRATSYRSHIPVRVLSVGPHAILVPGRSWSGHPGGIPAVPALSRHMFAKTGG
jgi:hypothetical protein